MTDTNPTVQPVRAAADWTGLPANVFVVAVHRPDAVVWNVECCSVPMAIGPEVRYVRADRIDALEAAIKKQANAVRTLQACEETELNRLRKTHQKAHIAERTLESERAANAILTDQVAALEAENKALREGLRSLIELNDEHSLFGGEMYRDRVDRTWEAARALLAKGDGQ